MKYNFEIRMNTPKIKFIIMLTSILTILGCGQKNSENNQTKMTVQVNKTEQYVSIDCQTGDITLILNSDSTFDLTILFWDSKTNQHNGQETLKGNWSKNNKVLTLITNNNKVIYELTTTNMKINNNEINATTYGFKSNDKDFFATGYNLLEKEQTDKFLIKATKEK